MVQVNTVNLLIVSKRGNQMCCRNATEDHFKNTDQINEHNTKIKGHMTRMSEMLDASCQDVCKCLITGCRLNSMYFNMMKRRKHSVEIQICISLVSNGVNIY